MSGSGDIVTGTREGTVVEFDVHVGLGRIQTSDGTSVMFHCAEIADGSRDIAVGTPVTFEIMRKFSRDEARLVAPR